jgi:starch phosphorylase
MTIQDLPRLAHDLWWTTEPEAHAFWVDLAGEQWRTLGQNPVVLLQDTDLSSLSPELMARATALLKRWPQGERRENPPTHKRIAYFCMEFGLHEGLPIYSGGLGMLAGDHLRSANDLGLDMVAVGLLYRQGYFTQTIDGTAQVVHYPAVDPHTQPMRLVRDGTGAPLQIEVPNGDTTYIAQAWAVQVGSVRLFLLDTDIPDNPPEIRALSQQLYGGDNQLRLLQEVLLGFGGKALLDAMEVHPDVFHMNEGHAAFLVLALAASIGWEATKKACVFTTHTPVPAGHDRFEFDDVIAALNPHLTTRGLHTKDWLPTATDAERQQICMSTLAINNSRSINGVSRLHAEVSTQMFAHLNAQVHPITNGVHPTAWMAPETATLLDKHLPGWRGKLCKPDFWTQSTAIPSAEWWQLRRQLRERLVRNVRTALGQDVLNHAHLTLCFARRFATYKRAGLMFTEPDRLAAILDKGAQIVFAGKAHPKDTEGQAVLAKIITWTQDPRFAGRVVFVPGYDPGWGRLLTQGADVWLNTPRRPREASGTSGQKAALNGNPNLSVLDGWWPEAFDGHNGWAIEGTSDDADADALYRLLEDEVLPSFADIPAWTKRMGHTMATCMPHFNTERMVRDYCRAVYDPRP